MSNDELTDLMEFLSPEEAYALLCQYGLEHTAGILFPEFKQED